MIFVRFGECGMWGGSGDLEVLGVSYWSWEPEP